MPLFVGKGVDIFQLVFSFRLKSRFFPEIEMRLFAFSFFCGANIEFLIGLFIRFSVIDFVYFSYFHRFIPNRRQYSTNRTIRSRIKQ